MSKCEEIKKQANSLLNDSINEFNRTRDAIKDVEAEKNEKESKRRAIAKKNLMESGQLAAQIIHTLNANGILLSLIGLRSLVESYINTRYTFAHPQKAGDMEWVYSVCSDYFDRGNDPEAIKSNLHEKRICERAESIGEKELYNKTFSSLCNYTHMMIYTALLNNPEKSEAFARDAYVLTITLMHDINAILQESFNVNKTKQYSIDIIKFRDEFDKAAR
jgi:hypothetical protein